jgi:hypothetical protein
MFFTGSPFISQPLLDSKQIEFFDLTPIRRHHEHAAASGTNDADPDRSDGGA